MRTMPEKNLRKRGAAFTLVLTLVLSLCFLLPAQGGAFTREMTLIPYKDLLIPVPVGNPLSIVGDERVQIEQKGLFAIASPPSVVSSAERDVFMSYTWIVMHDTGPVEIATTLEPALNLAKYQEYAGDLLAVEVRATDGIYFRDLSAEAGIFIPEIVLDPTSNGTAAPAGGGLALVQPDFWRVINYSIQHYEQTHCALRSGVVAECAIGGCPCKRWDKRTVAAFTQEEIALIEGSVGVLSQFFAHPGVKACAYEEANPEHLIIWGSEKFGTSVDGLEPNNRRVGRTVHERIVENALDQITDEPTTLWRTPIIPLYFYPVPPDGNTNASAWHGYVGEDEGFTPSTNNKVSNRLEIGLVKERMGLWTPQEYAAIIAHEMWHQMGQGSHPPGVAGNGTQDDFPYAFGTCLEREANNPTFY